VEGYQEEQLHESWLPDYIHIIYISIRQTDKLVGYGLTPHRDRLTDRKQP